MDLKALEFFMQVSQAGSFSAAASISKISQPTLSRHIMQLEDELGAKLFFRTGHGVELTEAGEALQRHTRPLLVRARQARAEVAEIGSNPSESVVLGLPPAIGRILTVPVTKRFLRDTPNGKLRIVECFTGYVQEWITSGRLDIGIVYEDCVPLPLDGELLWDEQYFLITKRDAASDDLSPGCDFADLSGIPLILPSAPNGLRLKLDRMAVSLGVPLNVVLDIDGLSMMLDLARRGEGATILTKPALHNYSHLDDMCVRPIINPTLTSTAMLVRSIDRPMTGAIRKLAQIIREEARRIRHTAIAT